MGICNKTSMISRSTMTSLFSIALEPLYPVLCQKMPPYEVPDDCIGPIDLANVLNSVPCSLSVILRYVYIQYSVLCTSI